MKPFNQKHSEDWVMLFTVVFTVFVSAHLCGVLP